MKIQVNRLEEIKVNLGTEEDQVYVVFKAPNGVQSTRFASTMINKDGQFDMGNLSDSALNTLCDTFDRFEGEIEFVTQTGETAKVKDFKQLINEFGGDVLIDICARCINAFRTYVLESQAIEKK